MFFLFVCFLGLWLQEAAAAAAASCSVKLATLREFLISAGVCCLCCFVVFLC